MKTAEQRKIEKQTDLIKALSEMIDWDNYPKDRLDEYYDLLSELAALDKEIEQGEEKGLPKNSERDWTEDFPHENGMYQNRCMDCGLLFFGHKRRVWCKLCGGKPAKADSDKRKSAEETEKGIIEFMLTDLFNDLQKNAYNFEYHNYHYKEANQIIRKHWEQYHKEQSVSDEMIEDEKKMTEKEQDIFGIKSIMKGGLIQGAKAMRDGKIGEQMENK